MVNIIVRRIRYRWKKSALYETRFTRNAWHRARFHLIRTANTFIEYNTLLSRNIDRLSFSVLQIRK